MFSELQMWKLKQVIISLSEAVLWVESGTPHRSLRSLCVVLQGVVICETKIVVICVLGLMAVMGGKIDYFWGLLRFLRKVCKILGRHAVFLKVE